MNEEEVVRLYTVEKMTLRMVAEEMGSNHHTIKRVLLRHGVEITQKGRIRKPFTEEHKRKLSEARMGVKPWSTGKKMSREHVLKNMAGKIKYDVDYNFYEAFEDVEKIKCLNLMLTRERVSKHFDTDKYKGFINKFYPDKHFNKIFKEWSEDKDNKWVRPSLDHIQPTSKGGSHELDNLQILTWFENRAKCDMTQSEWDEFKRTTKTESTYFK